LRDVGREDPDRHFTPGLRVACAVDLSRAAGTERTDDFVEAYAVSGGQRHEGVPPLSSNDTDS
jgi:hypothetical protein